MIRAAGDVDHPDARVAGLLVQQLADGSDVFDAPDVGHQPAAGTQWPKRPFNNAAEKSILLTKECKLAKIAACGKAISSAIRTSEAARPMSRRPTLLGSPNQRWLSHAKVAVSVNKPAAIWNIESKAG